MVLLLLLFPPSMVPMLGLVDILLTLLVLYTLPSVRLRLNQKLMLSMVLMDILGILDMV